MDVVAIGVLAIVWLGLGGWSFRRMGPSIPQDILVPVFAACLLLAPVVAGVVIAEIGLRTPKDDTPKRPEHKTKSAT